MGISELIKLFSRKGRKFYFFIWKTAGYMPASLDLFELAFVHKSVAATRPSTEHAQNNERLEYLGDAVLEAVVSDILFRRFPDKQEGFLSKLRSNLVCRARLNAISLELGLANHVLMTSRKDLAVSHIPGDALEAFVAAIYLDGGLQKVKRFASRHIANDKRVAEALCEMNQDNYKSRLVNLGAQSGVEVFFDTHRAPDDNNHDVNFVAEVRLADVVVGRGSGRSKKLAEQMAAQMVLEGIRLGEIEIKDNRAAQDDNPDKGSESSPTSSASTVPLAQSPAYSPTEANLVLPSATAAAMSCFPALSDCPEFFPRRKVVIPMPAEDVTPDIGVDEVEADYTLDSESDMMRSLGAAD